MRRVNFGVTYIALVVEQGLDDFAATAKSANPW